MFLPHEPGELVGWVLRRQRRHWQDTTGTTSREFLADLSARGLTADASRLSRWELGRMVARPAVLAGYEQVAGVLPMTLQAFANRVLRSQTTRTALLPIECTAEEGFASLDRLLDDGGEARKTESADGARAVWTLLRCNTYLAPVVAERLAGILVDRTIVSVGPSSLIAGDTLAQALTHPRLRAAVLDRVEEHLADSATGALADLPELLAERGAVSARWLSRQFGSTSGVRRTAAAWAALSVIDRCDQGAATRLARTTLAALEGTACGLEWRARVGAGRAEVVRVAHELEYQLEEPQDRNGGHGLSLGTVVGQMLSAEAPMTAHIYGLAFSAAGGDPVASRALLRIALDPGHGDAVRSRAARAVGYSPSADLAGDLDAALARAADSVRAVLAPGLERQLALARGHVLGRPVRLTAVRSMLDSAVLAPAALYALGMTGSPDLAGLSGSMWLPAPARARARWWLDRGAAITC